MIRKYFFKLLILVKATLLIACTGVEGSNFPLIGKVVVVADMEGYTNIAALDLDSMGLSVLISDAFAKHDPEWFPGRKQVIFASDVFDESGVFDAKLVILDVRTGETREIVGSPGINREPDVSPNGSFIALTGTSETFDTEIYILELASNVFINITNTEGADQAPDWSPDGSKIVFESNRSGSWEIYVMDIEGSDVTQITQDGANNRQPTWSTDGNQIAFISVKTGTSEIYVMDRNGDNIRQLTNLGSNISGPVWSPDGGAIMFVLEAETQASDLYVIDIVSGDVINLTGKISYNLFSPSWSE